MRVYTGRRRNTGDANSDPEGYIAAISSEESAAETLSKGTADQLPACAKGSSNGRRANGLSGSSEELQGGENYPDTGGDRHGQLARKPTPTEVAGLSSG